MTTNSHFDSQYMEIKSPPGAEDACFWYPADLVYKQGLCVCVCVCVRFSPNNKTKLLTIISLSASEKNMSLACNKKAEAVLSKDESETLMAIV